MKDWLLRDKRPENRSPSVTCFHWLKTNSWRTKDQKIELLTPTLHPAMSVGWLVGWLVGQSIGRSVPFLLFQGFWAFWAYSSCQDTLVTFSSTAPAHPHSTRVAVYPALFFLSSPYGLIYISYILFLSVTFYSSAFLYLLLCLFLPFYFVFLPLFYFFTIFEKKIFYKLCCIRKFTIHIVSIG